MHIKLVEPGFGSYTGLLGDIAFTDGVSDESLSRSQIDRIASSIRVETFEGEAVGSANDLLDRSHTAELTPPLETLSQEIERKEAEKTEEVLNELAELHAGEDGEPSGIANANDEAPAQGSSDDVVEHTAESLGAIADKSGIAGLREIAEQFDVKGKSVAQLIDGILAAQ